MKRLVTFIFCAFAFGCSPKSPPPKLTMVASHGKSKLAFEQTVGSLGFQSEYNIEVEDVDGSPNPKDIKINGKEVAVVFDSAEDTTMWLDHLCSIFDVTSPSYIRAVFSAHKMNPKLADHCRRTKVGEVVLLSGEHWEMAIFKTELPVKSSDFVYWKTIPLEIRTGSLKNAHYQTFLDALRLQ